MLDNLKQPFGLSEDMVKSISIATDFVNNHKDAHITFVGHSKGGGEALANAKATNCNAIVFNPAIPNYEIYGLGDSKYTAKATSYVVTGEILSSAYIAAEIIALSPTTPVTPTLIDDFIALSSRAIFNSKPFWETDWLPNEAWSPIEDHSMQEVITALNPN